MSTDELQIVKDAFRQADKTGDGTISRSDLVKVLEALGVWSTEECGAMVARAGDAAGAYVRYEDFVEWVFAPHAEQGAPSTRPRPRGLSAPYDLSAPSMENSRVALYGGTFDPISNAHLRCAAQIIQGGQADEVWLLPCANRSDKPMQTKPLDRYCMCQIAVNTCLSPTLPVRVCDADVFRDTAASTYDLLRDLQEKHPSCTFIFVVGQDWLQDLRSWQSLNHDWKEGDPPEERYICTGSKLVEEFDFLVIPRPGIELKLTPEDPTGLRSFGPRFAWLTAPGDMHLISGNLDSAETRRRAEIAWQCAETAHHGCLSELQGIIPLGVISYIRRKLLYIPEGAEIAPQ